MRAAVCTRYGPPDVLQIRDVPTPLLKANDLLIRTLATTVTSGDRRVRSLDVPLGLGFLMRLVFGFHAPRQPVLGTEMAGVVAAVGSAVRAFKPGDAVFAFSDLAMGCHAEYLCMAQDGAVLHKPEGLSFAEAAALSFGGTTALHYLRKASLQPGEKVLVNGASGAVGSAFAQLARHYGAEVTGVCSTANVALVQKSGAKHVIDYTQQDFTRNGETYDVIVDTVGNAPYARCRTSLRSGGRLLLIEAALAQMLAAPVVSLLSPHKVFAGPASGGVEALRTLADLAEQGVYRPVIDKEFAFEQIVEAHRYVDSGRKRGNVLVVLGEKAP